jgi:hypothetical protein
MRISGNIPFQVELLVASLYAAALDRHHGDCDFAERQMNRWIDEVRPVVLRKVAERHEAEALDAAAAEALRSGQMH